MLGMVFTEFVEMVEDKLSPEAADAMLQEANLPHGGAYTAVGYYPHEEIVRLVGILSEQTGMPAEELVRAFGVHLLKVFTVGHPAFFAAKTSVFDLLASVDAEIHREVRKLYPKAQLPTFKVMARSERTLELAYQSPRSMEALALGLIEGAGDHYGTPLHVSQTPLDAPQGGTLFLVELI